MTPRLPILLILLSGATFPVGAEDGPSLLTDLETTGLPLFDGSILSPPAPFYGSNPSQLLALPANDSRPERLWFVADDRLHGAELWTSDGTPEGTHLLKDVCVGECSAAPEILGVLGDRVVFWARTAETGTEPWVSDGTPEGTRPLADVCPGACPGIEVGELGWMRPLRSGGARIGELLYFAARSPEAGRELWRTDGTPEGTGLVVDLCPGTCDALQPETDLVALGERILAGADDGVLGIEPWSFGEGDAVLLGDFCPGSDGSSNLEELAPVPGSQRALLVPNCHGEDGLIVSTDGTAEGTEILAPVPQDRGVPAWLWDAATLPDGRAVLYLLFVGSPNPNQLWVSDGTPEGTRILSEAVPDSFDDLVAFDGGVALRARTGELWLTDGSPETTGPATFASGLRTLDEADGELLFTVRVDGESILVRTDGSEEATTAIGEVEVGPTIDPRLEAEAIGDSVVFAGWRDPTEGAEPWTIPASPELPGAVCPEGDPEALCFASGRFEARVAWTDHRSGNTGTGKAVASTDASGHFWFFDPANLEMTLKILDGTGLNQAHWMFSGAVSDVAVEITIEDHESGRVRTWTKEPGDLCGLADVEAFPEATGTTADFPSSRSLSEDGGSPRSVPDPESALSLQNGRFEVRVAWTDPRTEATGVGQASNLEGNEKTGLFWFFSEENLEMLVKILDARSINGNWWLLWGGLTDLELAVEVRDLETGRTETFEREAGSLCGQAVIDAFPDTIDEPPAIGPGTESSRTVGTLNRS